MLRRPYRASLRVRLTLWFVALLALILLAFSGVLAARLAVALQDSLDDTLRARAERIAGAIVANPALDQTALDGTPATVGEHVTRVYDPAGALAATDATGIADVPPAPDDVAAAMRGRATSRSVSRGDIHVRLLTVPLRPPREGVLQVGGPEDDNREAVAQLGAILATLIPLMLLVASGGGLFLADRALSPVDRITRAAREIEATDLHRRLPVPAANDEIGRLARTLNDLIARLEKAFARQRQFTADASHELRTPLTVMGGELDVTLRRERTAAEYRETLVGVRDEVRHLQRLVADLLLLARSDGSAAPARVPVDLAMVTAVACASLEPLAHARTQAFTLTTAPAVVQGDASSLERLVRNLVENAIQYTPAGGSIAVTVRRLGAEAVLRVADTGPGIAPDALPHLFERFYRADAARTRGSGGSGLGLAIAQTITQQHGGRIAVENTVGQGSTFTVTLPSIGAETAAVRGASH